MIVVLDASAVGSFLLPDEDIALGMFARELCRTEQLVVPPVWRTEVANLVLKAFRRGRIGAAMLADAGAGADQIASAATVQAEVSVAEIHAIAIEYKLTAYDAAYLELARRLGVPLLTGDSDLIGAAPSAGVELLLP